MSIVDNFIITRFTYNTVCFYGPKDSVIMRLTCILLCYCFQTFEQFEMDGCDNCDEWLHMKNNTDAVYDCTSSNFDG